MGQQGAVWTRIAKDRERWRTLAEGYFLQRKDRARNRIDQYAVKAELSTQCTRIGTEIIVTWR